MAKNIFVCFSLNSSLLDLASESKVSEAPKIVEIAQTQAHKIANSPEELLFDNLIDSVLNLDDIQLSDLTYSNAENVAIDEIQVKKGLDSEKVVENPNIQVISENFVEEMFEIPKVEVIKEIDQIFEVPETGEIVESANISLIRDAAQTIASRII